MDQERTLEQRAEEIYKALEELGSGWHGRAEIARQLNILRLQQADAFALEFLTKQGRVEAARHSIDKPIRERWEYRVTE